MAVVWSSRAFDEGQRLLAEGTASSQLRAIEKFEQAPRSARR